MGRTDGLWARAQALIPGGVNSPVRSFSSVGGEPFFVERGEGAYLYDTEGRRYVDYVLSWGPLILGHAHPVVTAALQLQLHQGTSYGAPTEAEVELAERIVRMVPSVEMVRLVNSGTEATMTTLRISPSNIRSASTGTWLESQSCVSWGGNCAARRVRVGLTLFPGASNT